MNKVGLSVGTLTLGLLVGCGTQEAPAPNVESTQVQSTQPATPPSMQDDPIMERSKEIVPAVAKEVETVIDQVQTTTEALPPVSTDPNEPAAFPGLVLPEEDEPATGNGPVLPGLEN